MALRHKTNSTIGGRWMMYIYAEMERMHGTGGLKAGKWEFPLTKVRVCPKESPR